MHILSTDILHTKHFAFLFFVCLCFSFVFYRKKDLVVVLHYLKKIIKKYGQHWVYYEMENLLKSTVFFPRNT